MSLKASSSSSSSLRFRLQPFDGFRISLFRGHDDLPGGWLFARASTMIDDRLNNKFNDVGCVHEEHYLHRGPAADSQARVPKPFFDYVDGGSLRRKKPLRANVQRHAESISFASASLVDVSKRELNTTILGEPAAMPLILAPVGSTGSSMATARSTPAVPRRLWNSLHARPCRSAPLKMSWRTSTSRSIPALRHEGIAASVLIERAIAAKCSALGADRRSAGARAAPR